MSERSVRRELALGLLLGGGAGLTAVALSAASGLRNVLAFTIAAVLVAAAWWMLNGASRWVTVFLGMALLLPPLPLSLGDAGPHPSLFAAAIGVWAGLARLSAWTLRRRSIALAFVSLTFALLLSVPMAAIYSGWRLALESAVRICLFLISVYSFFYLADGPGRELPSERLVRLLFHAGIFGALFACLDFYFQFPAPVRFAEQFVWLPGGVFRRAQGVFYEASTLGVFCVFLLVMLAAIAVLKLGPALRLPSAWLLGGGTVILAALVLSFSRAAMVSLVVSFGALLWLERENLRIVRTVIRLAFLALAGILAGGAALYAFLPAFLTAYAERFWYSGVYLLESPNLILSRRLESWSFLISYLHEHPWQAVVGIGYKTLPYTGYLGRPVVADNMYLSLLIETGVFGLVSLLALHFAVLVSTYRWVKSSQRAGRNDMRRLFGLWLFAFWCGFAVQMSSGDVLTYWRVLAAIVAALAVGVREAENANSVS
jgi:O-antigen ligase